MNFPQWKSQQKALWAVVREAIGRGKDLFKISELFADEMQQGDPRLAKYLKTTKVATRRWNLVSTTNQERSKRHWMGHTRPAPG